ncbi:MAG: CoA-binding protein [Gemmatimonadales bacterium]|jgi:predicted CoA-binding protein
MATMKEAVDAFLAQKRIAVAGVSRNKNEAANIVYRKLRDSGYEVFPINPNAETVEGDECYPDLKSVPGGVEGVVIATHPAVTEDVVRECADLGVPRVWMHRSFGQGSVSKDAVAYCREQGIEVIAGGCPMMFCQPVDFPHKCMRWILGVTGGLPKEV